MREKPGPDFVPAEPIPAATVILVRDAREGIEVFLMERSGFGAFGGLFFGISLGFSKVFFGF